MRIINIVLIVCLSTLITAEQASTKPLSRALEKVAIMGGRLLFPLVFAQRFRALFQKRLLEANVQAKASQLRSISGYVSPISGDWS